ncbi:MAG: AAA family ATPase [Alphaproteobacteria bacterium]|nr:AAA family ATPase [Alphaproteobacteria bacterium SS10]
MRLAPAFDPRTNPNQGGGGVAGCHVIVLGNEKGGSGKSTAAMHVIVGLLRQGYRVGAIDLDARQGTLSRYFERRVARRDATGGDLPCPTHRAVFRSEADTREAMEAEERSALDHTIQALAMDHDVLVIDAPGSDNYLSRHGHSYADTLITPMNDSFIDLDLLATVDPETLAVIRPSVYSELVWETRKRRAMRDRGSIDWIVMRNRLGHIDARNKRDIAQILERLGQRIGFRQAPGFGERVIFRELYLKGLTLLDLIEDGEIALNMSHVAARQEVRSLIDQIRLPPLAEFRPVAN